jgi:hypothetical protein
MARSRYKVTIGTEGNLLTAHAAGERTLDTVTALAIEISQAATAGRHTEVLIDARELSGRLGLMDNYLVVGPVFDSMRGSGILRAAIVDRATHALRGWVFETIAHNRGYNLRLFTKRDDAVKWLEE